MRNKTVAEIFATTFVVEDCQKKETTMNDNHRYLRGRVMDTFNKGVDTLEKNYHIQDDDFPKSAEEMVERIKADKFIIPTKDANGVMEYGFGPYGLFWRDPNVPADKEGFKAALDVFNDMKNDAIDAVTVLPEVDGLDALRQLQDYVKTLTAPVPLVAIP